MIIRRVSREEYAAQLQRYQPMIERALAYSHRPEDCIDTVEAAIEKLTAHVVAIEHDDNLVACGVIELIDTKQGKCWNIWTMAGDRIDEWLSDFLSWVETVSAQGYPDQSIGVMLGGRVGWSRKLRHLGYTTKAVIMEKRVETCH